MADSLQYVTDRMALADVMQNYVKGVDERDMDLYRSIFTEDVTASIGGVTYEGADAWLAFIAAALERFGPTQHMLGPMLAEIDGDTAECRTDLQATHYLKDQPDTTMTLWATYEQTMRRVAGVWKIARHDIIARGRRLQSG
jgi:ketosteroid isomerase-like protein